MLQGNVRTALKVLLEVKKELEDMRKKYGEKQLEVTVDKPNDKTFVITIQLED